MQKITPKKVINTHHKNITKCVLLQNEFVQVFLGELVPGAVATLR